MSRTRRAASSLIALTLLCIGVTSATASASSPTLDPHRLTHVHYFATFPMRLSPRGAHRGLPGGTPTGCTSTVACSCSSIAAPRTCRWSSWQPSRAGELPRSFRRIRCWCGWWSCPTPKSSTSAVRISTHLASRPRHAQSRGARPMSSLTPTPGGASARSRPASLPSGAKWSRCPRGVGAGFPSTLCSRVGPRNLEDH